MEIFDISNDDYQKSDKFQKFLANIEKKTELLESKFNIKSEI